MRLKPIIFKLYGEKYEVKKKINHGKNSKCFVVKKGNNLFFLKFMHSDDIDYCNERIPKLVLKGKSTYNRQPCDFRLNEFIDGRTFAGLKKLTMELLKEIILLFYSIHKDGMCIIDINKHNFMKSKNGKVYYVDSGGIAKTDAGYSQFHSFLYAKDPEEYDNRKYSNYNISLEIYYLGEFLNHTFTFFEKECVEILNKMRSYSKDKRFKTFEEIYNVLF